MKRKKIILFSIVLVLVLGTICYFGTYYHAEESVNQFLVTSDLVQVKMIPEGYYFDGPGTSSAIIFYPGAKVEETAYAPMLFKLAEEGVDTFLLSMPFHIAFFGENKVKTIMEQYAYDDYYLMGHSLRRGSCFETCF